MTQAKEIPAGTIVALSSGEYSDYSVLMFARVIKPLNADVWQEMGTGCQDSEVSHDYEYCNLYKCAPWLVTNGYIEEIEYTELHVGAYGHMPDWNMA